MHLIKLPNGAYINMDTVAYVHPVKQDGETVELRVFGGGSDEDLLCCAKGNDLAALKRYLDNNSYAAV